MQLVNRGLDSMACRTPWHFRAAGMSGLFSASPVNVQEAHGYMRAIQQCSTDLYRTAVTSSYCVSYRRLAIKDCTSSVIDSTVAGSPSQATEQVCKWMLLNLWQVRCVCNSFIMLFLDKSPKVVAALQNCAICPKSRPTAKIAASAISRISSESSYSWQNCCETDV